MPKQRRHYLIQIKLIVEDSNKIQWKTNFHLNVAIDNFNNSSNHFIHLKLHIDIQNYREADPTKS